MIGTTYVVRCRDEGGKSYLRETVVGYELWQLMDDLLLGEYEDILSIHKIEGESFTDVSDEVCVELRKRARTGDRLSKSAKTFLDWNGMDLPEAAE